LPLAILSTDLAESHKRADGKGAAWRVPCGGHVGDSKEDAPRQSNSPKKIWCAQLLELWCSRKENGGCGWLSTTMR